MRVKSRWFIFLGIASLAFSLGMAFLGLTPNLALFLALFVGSAFLVVLVMLPWGNTPPPQPETPSESEIALVEGAVYALESENGQFEGFVTRSDVERLTKAQIEHLKPLWVPDPNEKRPDLVGLSGYPLRINLPERDYVTKDGVAVHCKGYVICDFDWRERVHVSRYVKLYRQGNLRVRVHDDLQSCLEQTLIHNFSKSTRAVILTPEKHQELTAILRDLVSSRWQSWGILIADGPYAVGLYIDYPKAYIRNIENSKGPYASYSTYSAYSRAGEPKMSWEEYIGQDAVRFTDLEELAAAVDLKGVHVRDLYNRGVKLKDVRASRLRQLGISLDGFDSPDILGAMGIIPD